MAITGQTKDEIRDAILADYAARVAALGLTLDTSEGSDAWIDVDAFAVDLVREQGNAEALGAEVYLPTATAEFLQRAADVQGVPARPGTKGRYIATVTGSSTDTIDATGRSLVYQGRLYAPVITSFALSAGSYDLLIEAADAGTAYNLADGASLTWDVAPLGVDVTATYDDTATTGAGLLPGTDAGTTADLLADVLAWRRDRPASGNPSDLVAITVLQESVGAAYVYPTLHPEVDSSLRAQYSDADLDSPGELMIVCVGPAQGTSVSNTREITEANIKNVRDYWRGVKDAKGEPLSGSVSPGYAGRLFSAQMLYSSFGVSRPTFTIVNVYANVTPTRANGYQWTGSATVSAATVGSVVVDDDKSTLQGLRALFYVGMASPDGVRGGWEVRTIATAVYTPGTPGSTLLIPDRPFVAAPSGTVYPAAANDADIRAAVFAYFDTLGPSDVPRKPTLKEIQDYLLGVPWPTGVVPTALQQRMADGDAPASSIYFAQEVARRMRFPPESWTGPASVYVSKLTGVIRSAGGVVNAVVTTPAADTSPASPLNMLYLGELRLMP